MHIVLGCPIFYAYSPKTHGLMTPRMEVLMVLACGFIFQPILLLCYMTIWEDSHHLLCPCSQLSTRVGLFAQLLRETATLYAHFSRVTSLWIPVIVMRVVLSHGFAFLPLLLHYLIFVEINVLLQLTLIRSLKDRQSQRDNGLSWETLSGKKTQQNFFTIDSTKYNVKMKISFTKKNGAPTERYSAQHKPTYKP